MSFLDFLNHYFFSPDGLNLIVGIVLSILVEKWPAWEDYRPVDRRLIIYGMTLAFAFLGAVAKCLYTGDCTFDATFWPAIRTAGEVFGAAHVPHTAMMYLKELKRKRMLAGENADAETHAD